LACDNAQLSSTSMPDGPADCKSGSSYGLRCRPRLETVLSQETPLFDALLNGIGALLVFGHKRPGWTSIVDVDDLRILHHYVYDAGWRCALLGG
jgi:hypothetical protein